MVVRNGRKVVSDEGDDPTPTAPLITCLRDWESPECRIGERHRPKFAPNFARARYGSQSWRRGSSTTTIPVSNDPNDKNGLLLRKFPMFSFVSFIIFVCFNRY